MKNFKYYFLRSLPIIFIVLVIASIIMLFDIQKRVDKMNAENTVKQENEEVKNEVEKETEEVENEVVENVVEEVKEEEEEEPKEEVKNTVKNEVKNTVTVIEKNQSSLTEEEKDELNTDDNKEKAVKLVKEKYDTGSGMIFFCDSVLSTGEFIVGAKSSSSSTISAYYRVNLTTGEVSIMF